MSEHTPKLDESGIDHLPPNPECDFCGEPTKMVAVYTVKDAVVMVGGKEVTLEASYWAACATCHELVMAEDLDTLLGYSDSCWTTRNRPLVEPGSFPMWHSITREQARFTHAAVVANIVRTEVVP